MTIKDNNISESLQTQVKEAISNKTPLFIRAGNSKHFYGNKTNVANATELDVSPHTGIISYEPTELYITVRAGTRLSDIEALLAKHQQILPFEPPMYSTSSTIGGAIAAGISGPRRTHTGSVRDSILGVKMLNGEGEIVNFGGQVVKNVAGYDLSRLMVRSLGTLGILLNISIRLLPKPEQDTTFIFNTSQDQALVFFQDLRVQQLPVSATLWHQEKAYIRVSASEDIIAATQKKLQSQQKINTLEDSDVFWQSIRDHKHAFFTQTDKPLWRFSVTPATGSISRINDDQLIEWGGAQRWVNSNAPANIIYSIAKKHNALVTSFNRSIPGGVTFPTLEPALFQLHKQLKKQMDPHGIFNPNRMYNGL